jgi:hypothetical protein
VRAAALVLAALAIATLVPSCGPDEGSPSNGECPSGYARKPLLGVREEPTRGCVDVDAEAIVPIEVCESPFASSSYVRTLHACLRRIDDGERYWVAPLSSLTLPLPGAWEFCDGAPNPDARPPRACFMEVCPDRKGSNPVTTCAEGATRTLYDCGGNGGWDKNCCRRWPCDAEGECPSGFECREVLNVSPPGSCWAELAPDQDPITTDLNDPRLACSCSDGWNLGEMRLCVAEDE